jgi:hypothetical protein
MVWLHLVKRFFGFLRARSLTPREQAEVRGLLGDGEWELFWGQGSADQRHALQVSRRVLESRPGDRAAAKAALLHDVGKRHVRMGALQRSLATVLDGLRLPLPRPYRRYRDHGEMGARDLESVGAGELTVAFARYHASERPSGVDEQQWAALARADRA